MPTCYMTRKAKGGSHGEHPWELHIYLQCLCTYMQGMASCTLLLTILLKHLSISIIQVYTIPPVYQNSEDVLNLSRTTIMLSVQCTE